MLPVPRCPRDKYSSILKPHLELFSCKFIVLSPFSENPVLCEVQHSWQFLRSKLLWSCLCRQQLLCRLHTRDLQLKGSFKMTNGLKVLLSLIACLTSSVCRNKRAILYLQPFYKYLSPYSCLKILKHILQQLEYKYYIQHKIPKQFNEFIIFCSLLLECVLCSKTSI